MGAIIPVDSCGIMPATFLELLAASVRVDDNGVAFLNVTLVTPESCQCDPFMDCDKNHMSPEEVVANLFATDNCGNLALKIGNCDGLAGFGAEDGEPQ